MNNLVPYKRKFAEISNGHSPTHKRRKIDSSPPAIEIVNPSLPVEIIQKILDYATPFYTNLLISSFFFSKTIEVYSTKGLPHYYAFKRLEMLAKKKFFPEKMHITGDRLDQNIVHRLTQYPFLKSLKISFEDSGEVHFSLVGMTNLTELSFDVKKGSKKIYYDLTSLKHLRSLNVPYCLTLKNAFLQTTELQNLRIYHCPSFSGVTFVNMSHLSRLEKLTLDLCSNNDNVHYSFKHLIKLTNLQNLAFSNISLKYLGNFQLMANLSKLTYLKFRNTFFGDENATFPPMISLRHLDLSYNGNLPLNLNLAALTNLETFTCDHSNISYQKMIYLPLLTKLTSLSLSNSHLLRVRSGEILLRLTQLKKLDIRECPGIKLSCLTNLGHLEE